MKATLRLAIASALCLLGVAGTLTYDNAFGRGCAVLAALAAGVVWGEVAADREAARIEETLVLRLAVLRRTVARSVRDRDAAYRRAETAEANLAAAEEENRMLRAMANGGRHHG